MTALERLKDHTYEVRHNPNCPSPFLMITCGEAFEIGRHDKRNFYTYGMTLEEAAQRAVDKIDDYREGRARARRIAEATHKVRGVIWA